MRSIMPSSWEFSNENSENEKEKEKWVDFSKIQIELQQKLCFQVWHFWIWSHQFTDVLFKSVLLSLWAAYRSLIVKNMLRIN